MRSQSCVRYRRRGVEASLWAMAVIRAARTVMVTLLRSPGRAIALFVMGRGSKAPIATTLPHSDFGDPECCGCLNGVIRGDQADIVCNECGTVLRTVPAPKRWADADRAGNHPRGCRRNVPALRVGN